MAKTSKTMLNSKGESGHPCLVPDFRGNAFNFSPLRMFAVGLSYIAFIMLRYVPSIPTFWRVFVSVSVLVMGLLRFSISFWFSCGKLYFYKNLSISSTLSNLLAYNC